MAAPSARVFLDSNVIFSALYSPGGAPGILLARFIEGRISVVVSQMVLEEIVRTIADKLPGAIPALRRLLLNAPPQVVPDPTPESLARWAGILTPGDAAIIESAIAARPDYFVTGDNHFLRNKNVAEKSGLRILSPARFLKTFEESLP